MTYARTPKAPLFATLIAALAATAQRAAAADPVYEAGPIWNQGHAGQVCPAVAASHGGEWTGQWWTTVWGRMSVCQVR